MTEYKIIFMMLDYDPHSGEIRWSQFANRNRGRLAGCIGVEGYRQIKINGVQYKAHRVAYLLFHGYWPHGPIDHINGERDDNRIRNIRDCQIQENCRNKSKQKSFTASIFKGVAWLHKEKKWTSRIMVDGNRITLGRFSCEEEAAKAYAEAAELYHKDFAKHPGVYDEGV